MAAITLYNYELDENCYRVRLMLSFLGLRCDAIAIDMVPGHEEKSPPMLALNPLGTLPVMKDGDLVLHDARPVVTYLARAYDKTETWLPLDPVTFASVMQWLDFSASSLFTAVEARKSALFGLTADFATLQARSKSAFRIMDDHMTRRHFDESEWFAGNGPTIADLALFPSFALSRDFGIDHDEFPALRRWLRRFRALPGFKVMPGIPDYH